MAAILEEEVFFEIASLFKIDFADASEVLPDLGKPAEARAQALCMMDESNEQARRDDLARQLISVGYSNENALWAASQVKSVEEVKETLEKTCGLCFQPFLINEFYTMLNCIHMCCVPCAKAHFTTAIRTRSVTDCNCPFCKMPNLTNFENETYEYFSYLDTSLKSILAQEDYALFQRKLRDRTLSKHPEFKWCIDECTSGYFARSCQKCITCPDCGSKSCSDCRAPWKPQHEGISCEQFAAWKKSNDPELQKEAIARHFKLHGITCPNCHFKFSLSRGGCARLICTQCEHSFCLGCNNPFKTGSQCNLSSSCAQMGIHGHHPRNCYFYLRDKDAGELQELLKMENVAYATVATELLEQQEIAPHAGCWMPLQHETCSGWIDAICEQQVSAGHAGLCSTHYVEYLAGVIYKAHIDPVPIMNLNDCMQELRRRNVRLPERGPWDDDIKYRGMCQEAIKNYIPLK